MSNQFHAIKSCDGVPQIQKLKSALLRMQSYVIFSLLKPGVEQNTVMHAPPFSLECVVSDFCIPDAVHLHFSKSSSKHEDVCCEQWIRLWLVFWGRVSCHTFLVDWVLNIKWVEMTFSVDWCTYLIFTHLLDIEHPVNQKVHFMAKPMSSKHKSKSDSLFTRWTKTALMIYKDFPDWGPNYW